MINFQFLKSKNGKILTILLTFFSNIDPLLGELNVLNIIFEIFWNYFFNLLVLVKLAIVILNWNGKNYLEKFLPSLIKNCPHEECCLYVIDNASTDGSVEFIQKSFPLIKIIVLDKNYGFTGGYNRGLRQIESQYYLILNSDIEVVPGWISPLLSYMDKNPNVGICGPKLLDYHNKNKFEYAGACGGFLDKYGYPFCRGRIFDSIENDNGQYDELADCFWITGAALLIRSELFIKYGGFDESFFAHMEEIDLCWRIQNMGFKIVCVPESKVYHVGGGTLNKLDSRKTYYNFKNNLSLLFKNLPSNRIFPVLFVRLFLDQIAALRMLFQGNFKHFASVYKGYCRFIFSIKSLLNKRKLIKRKNPSELNGYYNKSIVFAHFIKGKKFFNEL